MDLSLLKDCSLFRGVEEGELAALLKCMEARAVRYGKGETIFHAGDPAARVGVVLSGEVQITREDYRGNRSVLAVLGPAQLFGEVFACAGVERLPVRAAAAMDSEILLVSCARIITTCSGACLFHNRVVANLLRIVAAKNLVLNQKIELLSQKTTREKLLAFLHLHGEGKEGRTFTIPYDRQALADYLGVERSAMSAELGKLRREGLIDFHRSTFRLLK